MEKRKERSVNLSCQSERDEKAGMGGGCCSGFPAGGALFGPEVVDCLCGGFSCSHRMRRLGGLTVSKTSFVFCVASWKLLSSFSCNLIPLYLHFYF